MVSLFAMSPLRNLHYYGINLLETSKSSEDLLVLFSVRSISAYAFSCFILLLHFYFVFKTKMSVLVLILILALSHILLVLTFRNPYSSGENS